jgi:hypothetical protein
MLKNWSEASRETFVVRSVRTNRIARVMRSFITQLKLEQRETNKLARIGLHAAEFYADRRNKLQLEKCFDFMREFAAQRVKTRTERAVLRAKADAVRQRKVKETVFGFWKEHASQPKKAKSLLYAVFSGWKFYAKERVLLKKYLFECGESIQEISMVSTLELK